MTAQEIAAIRAEKDQFFKASPHSPLTPEQQETFNGLRYYRYHEDAAFELSIQADEGEKTITIETTTGELRRYARAGTITFTLDEQPITLAVYNSPHGYFLPFVDANTGVETYPAGRYLEPEALPGNRIFVDFNLAYNPYCAYSEGWSCPITPAENRVDVAVRAGEMLPMGEWVTA